MCEGVESENPGDCPKCGTRLERNPAYKSGERKLWTCPMHPEIQEPEPGACPKCGMNLEPMVPESGEDEDDSEIRSLKHKTLFAGVLMATSFGVMTLARAAISDALTSRVPSW